ncbi:sensor histidine kinase [Lysinibacillus sp. 2017]|uniref:sensor histidine kinase n=1 Tax=unclassified Lysinibacillus TaxID=2636778 RepID=UPI000D5280A9|nr:MULTISPECIES: HAMP domain-containing sensor histidine kinase [unclassified Lysinibacillus]AWE07276.1 sensor histidine kinase [Lysinibacillus sp. 2017]TGN33333.1 HAMP domain-containing histidine kinase [Lysinibacillus sp. S2017]
MKTLYKQYIIVTIIVIVASIGISMILVNGLYNLKVREDTDSKNLHVAQQVSSIIQTLPQNQMDDYLSSVAQLGYQIVTLNDKNKPTFYGAPFDDTNMTNDMLHVLSANSTYHGIRDYRKHFSIVNHYANDVENTIGIPLQVEGKQFALFIRSDNASSFTEMHYLIVGFLLVSAIMIFAAMIFLARQLVRPIKQLQLATEQIAQENYDINLNINRNDELGLLATQFQKMAQHLAENDQLKKDFINNVSHDFQSPLLNIQGYASVLKDAENTEEERIQYLEIIEQETKRLSALTKQLLLLSSLDQRNLPIEKKRFAVDQQLKNLLFAKRWLLDDREMELVYELEPLEIFADEHLLEQVWDNLLTNAIRYSENKGKIVVTCTNDEQTVNVVIKDYGIGIPEEAIERVTDRFYRVDTARSNQSSGLGLAIVAEIVQRHEGELIIKSELGKGTTITVQLPKN